MTTIPNSQSINPRHPSTAGVRSAVAVAAVAALAALAFAAFGFAASAQAASPAWKVAGATGPTHLPPMQSEVQRVAVSADGGTYRLTATLATGSGTLSFTSGFGNFTAGSDQVTGVFAFTPFSVGQVISGPVPAGTTITAVAGNTLTISAPAQSSQSFAFITAASKEVTAVTTSSGAFAVGQTVTGTGIPAATTITAVGADTLTLSNFPTQGGTRALTATATTPEIAFDAAAAAVEGALDALPGLDVAVTGGPGGEGLLAPFFVIFGGGFAETDVAAMGADGSALVGAGSQATVKTTVAGGPGRGEIVIDLANVGGAPSSGAITLQIGPLPSGIETAATPFGAFGGWSCSPGAGQTEVTCNRAAAVASEARTTVRVPVRIDTAAAGASSVPIAVAGGGVEAAGEDSDAVAITVSPTPAPAGVQMLWAGAFDEDGQPYVQAGGHPARAAALFRLNTVRSPVGEIISAADVRDVKVDIPPGFVGDPLITPRCPQQARTPGQTSPPGSAERCPATAAIGLIEPLLTVFPGTGGVTDKSLYNNEPRFGAPAQFSFGFVDAEQTVVASLRSDGDYGVTVTAPNVPLLYRVFGSYTVLDGNPPGAGGQAFLTNPTGCSAAAQGTPVTTVFANSWQQPLLFDRRSFELPKVTGCDQLVFEPSFGFQPDTASAASPTGATADLSIPQDGLTDPDELASPHLKKSVVTLPEGLVLNPSAANGLAACSTAQIGLKGTDFPDPNPVRFDKSSPACPDASKVATAEIDTPLLEDKLHGTVYLAAQGDNPFGSLIALYIVIDDAKTGTVVKLAGRVDPDPRSGRVTATFDHNPQLPFSNLKLRFRGGPRANLSTPDVCGSYSTSGVWTPWSAPDSGPPAQTSDPFAISSGAGGSACPQTRAQRPFSLGFTAGATDRTGRAFAPFTLRLTRPDGSQELDRVDVATPRGMLASLRGVPYCPEPAVAQAIARGGRGAGAVERALPSCPAASQVGSTSVGAGVGPQPFYAGGNVYLAGPYKGAPLSLVVVVPAVAGPFDLGVQVVRTALHVDRRTAQVTAVSDAIPKIIEGVPLQIQDVRIHLDRPGFTLNPSDCSPKQVQATVMSAGGARADLANHYQATGCKALPFEPKLKLRLTGRRQIRTGRHPGIRARVTQDGVGEAGVKKAEVRLPKSLALDPDNAQALCEFEDGTKPDLENHCPKGSIVGRARAKTLLLDDDLAGNVYFVKNIRIDQDTGNEIRTLPMIIVALRGQVAVNLIGESSTTRSGRLVNTFDQVPDAPISQFNLNIRGGRNGILTVTRTRRARINLCAKPNRHIAQADMDGQNGRRHDRDIRMNTPCRKRRQSAARVCRKRTNSKPALRRCVRRVKAKRRAAARRSAVQRKQAAATRGNLTRLIRPGT